MIPSENTDVPLSTGMQGNRLAKENSLYLIQHADNPVNWQPWDEQALLLARANDIPIFLSIGYAACHWCHVMERESFEDRDVADFLNTHFVSIKVDREERPEIDAIYMNAVTALTGSGGWPLNVFLTPDLRPFYGGTYFPPESRYGIPAFGDVIRQIAALWQSGRSRLLQSAEQLTSLLARNCPSPQTVENGLSVALRGAALHYLETAYDATWGGWGGAPKFPSPGAITLLLRSYSRERNAAHLEMALSTLRKMAQGGMYDQLGGGFHRYSTDERWHVPHFEKMLYDNAQLAVSYMEAWQVTHDSYFKQVACDTINYALSVLRDPVGAFYSSEDADSDGDEGKYYLWDKREILSLLGTEDGEAFSAFYSVRDEGNILSGDPGLQGKNVLSPSPGNDKIQQGDDERFFGWREKLLNARKERVRPAVDDKIITSWNALMVSALVRTGFVWNIPEFISAAYDAGSFLRQIMFDGVTLYRSWRRGEVRFPGYLDDYAFTANAFTDLYECTGEQAWLDAAKSVADSMIEGFYDTEGGGFYSTSKTHSNLIVRMKAFHDTAEPSGNALAAQALSRLGILFDVPRYLSLARESLNSVAALSLRNPPGYIHTVLAADYLLEAPFEIVFCGLPNSPNMLSMKRTLAEYLLPCKVMAWACNSPKDSHLPMCAGKTMQENRGAVYLCHQNTCYPPATTEEDLKGILRACGV